MTGSWPAFHKITIGPQPTNQPTNTPTSTPSNKPTNRPTGTQTNATRKPTGESTVSTTLASDWDWYVILLLGRPVTTWSAATPTELII